MSALIFVCDHVDVLLIELIRKYACTSIKLLHFDDYDVEIVRLLLIDK